VYDDEYADEEGLEGEEDNISETMQTLLQSTQKSMNHPVAHFNESHPTQQIHGMSNMKRHQAQLQQKNMNQPGGSAQKHNPSTLLMKSANSPGNWIENAYQVGYQHMQDQQRSR